MHLDIRRIATAACVGCLFLLQSCGGGNDAESQVRPAATSPAPGSEKVDQLIVRLRATDRRTSPGMLSKGWVQAMSLDAGEELEAVREGALQSHVLRLPRPMSLAEARAVAQRLRATGRVEFAEPDVRARALSVPNDPYFRYQWHLDEPESVAGGINAVGAWDITQGSPSVVVAVVDSGILAHSDLAAQVLPGYDFVSTTLHSNDGNGRDNDPSDPGEWISANETGTYGEDKAKPSTWHGTHVAGIVAAAGNNASGVVGVAWRSRILPVRVLGKGGGTTSDITDGIVWAAGGNVPGVPANPYPAKVINLSLGGSGVCSQTYQNAIDFARSKGAVVIVAAGNDTVDMADASPANCAGVISVAAVSKTGALASYSNFGSGVTLSAPGGDSGGGIFSTGDMGITTPLHDNSFIYAQGTSMAAPVVSGVAALMLAVNPALTPDQIKAMLVYSASKFPTGTKSDCTPLKCGAGIVNALSAVRAAASGPAGQVLPVPQSGWWWNPAQAGTGYALEIRNDGLFMAGFQYDASGAPTWFVASGTMTDAMHFTGDAIPYSGGQTLKGVFKPTTAGTSLGVLNLAFSDANHGSITWPNGVVTTIQRFDIDNVHSASLSQTGFTPEAGWWWNAAEPGRGFALEIQGTNFFIAGFMYDDLGKPTWYVSNGQMASATRYVGNWMTYGFGQTMGGAYKAPVVTNDHAGTLSIDFSDTRNGTLILPDGRSIPIVRFQNFGTTTPIATNDPPNAAYVKQLLGTLNLSVTDAGVKTSDIVTLRYTAPSTTAGRDVAVGTDVSNYTAYGGYSMTQGYYYLQVNRPATDTYKYDWYQFSIDFMAGVKTIDGYYFKINADGTNTAGIKFTGTFIPSATALVQPVILSRPSGNLQLPPTPDMTGLGLHPVAGPQPASSPIQ